MSTWSIGCRTVKLVNDVAKIGPTTFGIDKIPIFYRPGRI